MRLNQITIAAAALAMMVAATSGACAGWVGRHPARAHVDARARSQQHRITEERREGDLTHEQAVGLRQQVHSTRLEAHNDAVANGGHLTGSQARQIQQEQNSTSAQIPR